MSRINKVVTELIKEIDPQAATKDLKNADLEKLLADLEAGKELKGTDAKWVVAKGKTITSRGGMLKAGDEVAEKLIAGGSGAMRTLIAKECVVKA